MVVPCYLPKIKVERLPSETECFSIVAIGKTGLLYKTLVTRRTLVKQMDVICSSVSAAEQLLAKAIEADTPESEGLTISYQPSEEGTCREGECDENNLLNEPSQNTDCLVLDLKSDCALVDSGILQFRYVLEPQDIDDIEERYRRHVAMLDEHVDSLTKEIRVLKAPQRPLEDNTSPKKSYFLWRASFVVVLFAVLFEAFSTGGLLPGAEPSPSSDYEKDTEDLEDEAKDFFAKFLGL
eukprot:752438_1